MANPNIVNVATINGNTKAAAVGTTITEICSNGASSGKIFKVNSLYVANIDGTTAADLTVNHYSQAALRAVGPLSPPAPYSPGQSPGGEGEPSGWMERT